MEKYVLNMEKIEKSFGSAQVLKDVNLRVRKGDIHALLGENGAGKSTLMNILGGVLHCDSGEISVNGEKVKFNSPMDSQEKEIAFIHQELNVVNDLMVYENMFLGYELSNKWGKLNAKEMCAQTEKVFSCMNVEVNPRAMVRDLQSSYKQIIEIGKAILRNAKIIIMDEPTTSLTEPEVKSVFSVMKKLTEVGTTIVFISHKLGEVVEFCDAYTVLRNGENVKEGLIEENGMKISTEEIARHMVGRDVLGIDVFEEHKIGEIVLEVRNVCVDTRVNDVSFALHKGEVLGFTGLLGDGKEELARALFGDLKLKSGSIYKNGNKIEFSTTDKAKKGKIGYLPDNRKENAIIKDLSVQENMTIVTLPRFCKLTRLNHKLENKMALEYKEALNIKVDNLENKITSLSGGNQQKVVLAKWMYAKPDVMILSNPTQGVDVGAKNEIYSLIYKMAKKGTSVIVMSGEAEEVIKLCDRTIIMYHGEVRGELSREEVSQDSIMILSTGGSIDNKRGA
ncbi:MAG: sugar ABC transporter ATP-binding protein [Lachnospiraceae bacterium]|nr:sugar ABC transporter ATP-binding protein [Lachnospiraceae bacterium]